MSVLSLGAINKITGEYVYPKIANKKDEYICPDCNKELILCQGKIKVHHFRHKVDTINPCHHYSKPTESQIHKDAKMLLKNLLERKITISFIRKCCCCEKNEDFEIPEMSETSVIELEHRFEYNGLKIADVAYIDNGELLCIFEICNTHKTSSENRPDNINWFEINAETLIKLANDNSSSSLQIPCIRCEKCEDCIEKEKMQLKNKKDKYDRHLLFVNKLIEKSVEDRDEMPQPSSQFMINHINNINNSNPYELNLYLNKCFENNIYNEKEDYDNLKSFLRKTYGFTLGMFLYIRTKLFENLNKYKKNIEDTGEIKNCEICIGKRINIGKTVRVRRRKCFACQGTGISYRSDGDDGSCLNCCCIYCGNFNEECLCCDKCGIFIKNNRKYNY
jgi:uncharacterized protein YkuJ